VLAASSQDRRTGWVSALHRQRTSDLGRPERRSAWRLHQPMRLRGPP